MAWQRSRQECGSSLDGGTVVVVWAIQGASMPFSSKQLFPVCSLCARHCRSHSKTQFLPWTSTWINSKTSCLEQVSRGEPRTLEDFSENSPAEQRLKFSVQVQRAGQVELHPLRNESCCKIRWPTVGGDVVRAFPDKLLNQSRGRGMWLMVPKEYPMEY